MKPRLLSTDISVGYAEAERHLHMATRALLLAGVDRAGDDFQWARHRDRDLEYDGPDGTAEVSWIHEHLGWWTHWDGDRWWHPEGPTESQVRRELKTAERDGHAYVIRRKGHAQIWGVTPDGDAWLREWQAENGQVALPESPRHREWRMRREDAIGQLGACREAVRQAAAQLADFAEAASPDEIASVGYFRTGLSDLERALGALTAEEPT